MANAESMANAECRMPKVNIEWGMTKKETVAIQHSAFFFGIPHSTFFDIRHSAFAIDDGVYRSNRRRQELCGRHHAADGAAAAVALRREGGDGRDRRRLGRREK